MEDEDGRMGKHTDILSTSQAREVGRGAAALLSSSPAPLANLKVAESSLCYSLPLFSLRVGPAHHPPARLPSEAGL